MNGRVPTLRLLAGVIRAERARKPAGARLLRYRLMQKKVPRALIDRLVAEADEAYDAVDEARALAQRRLAAAAMRTLEPAVRRRRVWATLARRGFDADTIRNAVDGLIGDDDPFVD